MFGLFEKKSIPKEYTKKHLEKDCSSKRINNREAYEVCDSYSHSGYPLCVAMKKAKDVSLIQSLLKYGADPETAVSELPYYFNTNSKALQMFINAGLNVNTFYRQETLLGLCIHHLHLVKTLVKNGADINLGDKSIYSTYDPPISRAAQYKEYEVMKYLVNCGALLDDKRFNETPLLYAVLGNSEGAIHMMGRSAANPDPKCVKLLIDAGANVNYSKKSGAKILDIADFVDNNEVIKLLENAGATRSGISP